MQGVGGRQAGGVARAVRRWRRGWPLTCLLALALTAAACSSGGSDHAARASAPSTNPAATPATPSSTVPATARPDPGLGVGDVGFAQAYLPMTESAADLATDFDTIRSVGARWVRFDLSWSLVQGGGPNSWNWGAADRAVQAASSRGLEVLPILAYTPTWARPRGTTDKYAPTDVQAYATFVAQAAARYAPQGVHTWEIWNEENIASFWRPAPDPAAYGRLLRAASAAIKAVDPGATVLVGGLASAGPTLDWQAEDGSEISPWRFLNQLYEQGVGATFDAVADHPYAALPYAPDADVPGNSFRVVTQLHDLMASFGDGGKRIWATETGAYTGTAHGAVSEQTQADYAARYLTQWRAWDFTGPLFFFTLRDLGTNPRDREQNWGFVRADHTPKLVLQTVRRLLGAS